MGKDKDKDDDGKKPYAVRVKDHKYYSAHDDKETIKDLLDAIQERAKHYGHIKKNEFVDRLQLVSTDNSDKGELGHDIKLADVAMMRGESKILQAVIIAKEEEKKKEPEKPPPPAPPKDDVIRCWCCGLGR